VHTKFWSENLKGRDHSGRHKPRWEDNIRMVLGEIRWDGAAWNHPAQDMAQWWAVVNMVMNLRDP